MKRRKYRKRRVPRYLYVISLGMFLSLGVGYSTLNSSFGMEGALTTSANTWDIHFENLQYAEDNVTASPVTITNNSTLSFDVTLTNPGDKYEFTFDIENEGNLDALIHEIEMPNLTDVQKKYLIYSLTYDDGTEIHEGDLLKPSEVKTVRVFIQYKNLRYEESYPENDIYLSLTMAINYYFPQQEKYNVTLDYGGTQSNYFTSNTEQRIEINDLEIANEYKVVACNNGAVANLNGNGKLVINNIKSDTVCRLETSLKNAITNIGNGKSNVVILRDDTTSDNNVSINSTQDITLNLNGKEYIIDGSSDSTPFAYVYGNLTVEDLAGNGSLKTLDQTLFNVTGNTAELNIKSGAYSRENSSTTGGLIFSNYTNGAIINLKDSTFTSDNSATLNFNGTVDVNINNCNIENETTYVFAPSSYLSSSIININNSVLTTPAIAITFGQGINYMYLCNSTIENATQDFSFVPYNATKVFYSNDVIFSNQTNVPTLNYGYSLYTIESTFACKK